MVTEDYVGFETAKLLKEKGFGEKCIATYNLVTGNFEVEEVYQDWTTRWKAYVSAPTLQMAMKWLRKVHNLHVEVHYNTFWDYYQYIIFYYGGKIESDMTYHSFENAAEAAIKYCLKNLI